MPVSDVLKNFRKGDYGSKKPEGGKEEGTSGPRSFKLTDDEAKEISQGYGGQPGQEQKCEVTGRLGPNNEFSVTSVHLLGGGEGEGEGTMPDQNGMAQELMAKMRPGMMQSQTLPSPS